MSMVVFAATLAFVAASKPFLDALRTECPELFQSFGGRSVWWYLWNRKLLMPYSKLVLFRTYRTVLASCPRSRAWASWLFIVHWVQLVGLFLAFYTALL
jgi:hypothetical protein